MSEPAPVITIDGPSGSGKGTISQILASKLGWYLLDSGALYRLVAHIARQEGIGLKDAAALSEQAAKLDVQFVVNATGNWPGILLAEDEVTDVIRTESCGNDASCIATHGSVREALLVRQRAFLKPPGLVADGRDMGTVVFPHAELKIFLTASPKERAKRRYKQLRDKGINVNLPHLFDEIIERDHRDSERAVAPLKAAVDAVVVDTSDQDIVDVVKKIEGLCRDRLRLGR